jgi:gliding motility-associated-like protein
MYSNLFANNYTLFVVDGNGCVDSIQNIQIIQPTEIMFTSVTHQDIECYKDSSGSISVVANGGTGIINYRLDLPTNPSNTTGNFMNLPAATYTVIATDSRGCTKTTNVIINANLQIVMNLQINQPICFGDDNGEIILNNTGGVAPILFSMNGGAFTSANQFINLSAGSYLFTIKDSNNCTVDTTIVLTEPEKVGAEIVVSEIKCNSLNDGKIKVKGLGGRGQFTYYIKPSFNINKHGVFSDLEAGNYTLTVKDSAGCDFDTLVTILPPANPFTIEFTKEDIGCLGLGNDGWAIATPVGGKAPYTYVWSTNPAQTKQEATQLKYGRYTLHVVDANGCEIKDSVYINPGPCCDNVFVPNAFSPNGDGRNDEFRIVTAAGFQLTQLDVYDRWGNKVWSTLDARKGWDGKYKGVDMDVNTYFYIFRYDCFATGEKMIKKGDVQLIR